MTAGGNDSQKHVACCSKPLVSGTADISKWSTCPDLFLMGKPLNSLAGRLESVLGKSMGRLRRTQPQASACSFLPSGGSCVHVLHLLFDSVAPQEATPAHW